MKPRVRYAPSPTGSPHVGNIRTAIFNWLFARSQGGVFIARLEDTDRDPERYKPETILHIEESLIQLGIEPDEWWKTDPETYTQSGRLEQYQAAARQLVENGFAYPCFCTAERLTQMREEQQARGVPSGYDRRCRRLSVADREKYIEQGLPYTIRLAVPLEGKTTYRDLVYGEITFENKLIDDQVLLKSSGWPTYHLAVVVDDHAHGITHVIRGEDWQPSTPKQILLYKAFEWEMPVWVHAPLIIGKDRKKLSKRHGSTKFIEFLEEGYLSEALFNFLVLLGWSSGEDNRELFSREELIGRFTLEGIGRSPAVFDYDKLRWMNGEYIRAMSPEELAARCLPLLIDAGLVEENPSEELLAYIAKVIPLVAERLKVLTETAEFTRFFFVDPEEADDKGKRKWLVGLDAQKRIQNAIEAVESFDGEFTAANLDELTTKIAESSGCERPPIIHTLRVCTTGRTVGPGLFETLETLGHATVLRRLRTALGWVQLEAE